jgi:hypothetical protein
LTEATEIRDTGKRVTESAVYMYVVMLTNPLDAAFNATLISVSMYLPGPHAGSVSGQNIVSPRMSDDDTERFTAWLTSLSSPPVLSITRCFGKPVDERDGVCEAVREIDDDWDLVIVWERV